MSDGVDIFKLVDQTKKILQGSTAPAKQGTLSKQQPLIIPESLTAPEQKPAEEQTPNLLGQTVELGKNLFQQAKDVAKTYTDEGIVSGVLKSVNTALNAPAEILMHFTGVSPILKELEKNKETKKIADIVNFIPGQINAEVDKRFEMPEQEIEKIQNPELKADIKSKLNSAKDVLKTMSQYAVFGSLGKLTDLYKPKPEPIIPETLLKEKPIETKIQPEAPEPVKVAEKPVEQPISTEPAVTLEQLKQNPTLADYVIKRPQIHGEDVLNEANNIKGIKTPIQEFMNGKELIGLASITPEGGLSIRVRRYGTEFGDKSRGGTWYEIPAFEGQRSSYESGWWGSREANLGIGGKSEFTKDIVLKNPYLFDWTGLGEGKAPLKLAYEILGKETTDKLKKGITGINAEKSYARLENAISQELTKQGYDGVVFYDKTQNMIHPKQSFIFGEQSPLQNIESKLKGEVTESIGETVPPVGMSTKYTTTPPKTELPYTKDTYKFDNPAIEQRYEQSHGLQKPSFFEKAKEVLVSLKNRATREYEHLPKTDEFAVARNELLKLGKQKDVQADRVINDLRGITLNLDKTQMGLFERKVLLDDLTNEMNEGRDLPFGFDRETLPTEAEKINSVVGLDPAVQEALTKRNALMEAVRQEYVQAMKDINFNVEGRFDNPNYFRHQVLEYANTKGIYGTGKKLKTPSNRGFLKQRHGSSYDINTNYLEAEYEVMSQMLYDVQIAKALKTIKDNYDIAPQLKKEGAEIPEGYVEWQPREGNQFYLASTIPESIAKSVLNGAMEVIGKEDINKSLAMGRERPSYVIPEQLAKTLDNLTKEKPKSMLFNIDRTLLTLWKQWQLLSPRRVFKYNIRNMTGDLDHVLTGNPSSISKIPTAFKELYDNYIGGKPPSPELQEWINRGGKQQTLQAMEIADVSKLNHFKNLIDRPAWYQNLPKRVFLKYWDSVRLGTDMRESLLRYATYLDYLSQLDKGKLKNYGASLRKEIDALPDIRDKAYRLSNDLLGAYDEIGLMGQGLRQYLFPFWSWKEANARIYKRLVQNAVQDGKTMPFIGKKLGVKSPMIAYKLGGLAVKSTALWSLLQVYNNLFFPQEEQDLNDDVRKRPHIILGKDSNGNTKAFTQVGSVGDLLSWFGLDEFPFQVDQILKGDKTLKQVGEDFAKAPLNVFTQGMSPYMKIPFEMITDKKLFPDFTHPTTIRNKGLYIAESVGLGNEYKALMKLPNKPYAQTMEEFFIYSYDPKQNAMFDVLEEKRRFLESKGQMGESVIGFISDKSNALYNYKQALRFKDKELADAFLKQYLELGGTKKGMRQSIRTFDPLYGLNPKEQKEFVATLTPELKNKLTKAIMYYKNIIDISRETGDGLPKSNMIHQFNQPYLPMQP